MPPNPETTARRVSGEGVGGVQVFDVEGVTCADFVKRHFVPQSRNGTGGLAFGQLVDGVEVVDECLVIEDAMHVRIMLHGGLAIEERVRALFEKAEIRMLPGSNCQTATSTFAQEVEDALQQASSVQTVLFLATASEGGLPREVEGIYQYLQAEPPLHVAPAASRLESLIQRAPFGCALMTPPRVGVFGEPNVGKSTLFNALIGEARTLVTDVPGTTRDTVEVQTEWEGFPFFVSDTAGLRQGKSAVEEEGIRRARALQAEVDVALVVVDRPADLPDSMETNAIAVLNKVDRLLASELEGLRLEHPEWVFISARDRSGLSDLRRRIVFRSVFAGPAVREMPCPFTSRQTAILSAARQHLPMDRIRAAAELARFIE